MHESQVQSPGREDPLEKGMATHSSILAWRIPWTEDPGGIQSMGSQRVGHDWAHTHTHTGWMQSSSETGEARGHFSRLLPPTCSESTTSLWKELVHMSAAHLLWLLLKGRCPDCLALIAKGASIQKSHGTVANRDTFCNRLSPQGSAHRQ